MELHEKKTFDLRDPAAQLLDARIPIQVVVAVPLGELSPAAQTADRERRGPGEVATTHALAAFEHFGQLRFEWIPPSLSSGSTRSRLIAAQISPHGAR